MTQLTLEELQTALRPLHTGLVELGSRIDGLASEMANVRTRVDGLASEMVAVKSELANVRLRVDGLPLFGVAVETLRHDVRMTRAAINDMARVNITAGEVESMHTDIDRTMARQDAIEARLATLERRGEQHKKE